jgi:hypothetical protein
MLPFFFWPQYLVSFVAEKEARLWLLKNLRHKMEQHIYGADQSNFGLVDASQSYYQNIRCFICASLCYIIKWFQLLFNCQLWCVTQMDSYVCVLPNDVYCLETSHIQPSIASVPGIFPGILRFIGFI